MSNLISQDLLLKILDETGASDAGHISRVLSGEFPRFSFQVRKRSDFDLSVFEDCFDQFQKSISEDWNQSYLGGDAQFFRDPAQLTKLQAYPYRERCFCIPFKSSLVGGSFFVYLQEETFFMLLNSYLGGADIARPIARQELTTIEMTFFKKIVEIMGQNLSKALADLEDPHLTLGQFPLSSNDQKKEFENPFLLAETLCTFKENTYRYAVALPSSYLDHLKQKLESQDEKRGKMDPLWKKVITNAFMETPLDLKVLVTSITMPFSISVSLKAGDGLPWNKKDTSVLVMQGERPRMEATLGVIDDNFALKIDRVL